MEFVYLFYILIAFVSGSVAERNRRCCRYSNSCTSQSSCILSDLSHPHDCLVKKDSKKDSIDPHIFIYFYAPYNHQYYPALDLLVNYIAKWDRLRFRFMNLGGDSNPRCVDIERNSTLIFENKVESQLFLSYDCEAGFYVLGNHQLINTAGTTYQFDMCLTIQRKLLEDNFEISLLSSEKVVNAQSGIDKIFYAMDPKTGITSQKNHDPWRWAMEVIENINFTKDYLVFVASPPMDTSSTLYENLSDNQTLMLTKYLSKMINANRVSKIEFPYSEPSSISSLVPKDIPKILHFAIPRQMKDFCLPYTKVI
ncbi:unnamed protein product [Lepeophtheirus salmonis]|uniref:(salmon louse) hypothetical protein n=1 Tax=Lepeophtheirus salmonis TaxID=72036 RepID=A0A7R8CE85_LEPSM|nr:unnamed protein product [Lepeophtheirus salmonis]CAF2750778.1 unnamed protein product [Lepeophtheirus salmonis]